MSKIPVFAAWTLDWTGSTSSHLLWWWFAKSWSHVSCKRILVTYINKISSNVGACFLLFINQHECNTKWEQILYLPKSLWMMVLTLSLLIPNSSAIHHGDNWQFYNSICCTHSMLSLITLIEDWPKCSSPSMISFPSWKCLNQL